MKTQICDLINGSKNVIRDLSASKYAGCPAGTSAEFAGTTIRERGAVAEAVKLSAESDPNFWHWLFDDDSPEFDNGAGDRLDEWDEFLKTVDWSNL